MSSVVVRKTSLLTSLLFGPIVLAGGLKSCGKKDQPTSILFGPIVLAVVLGMTGLLRILFNNQEKSRTDNGQQTNILALYLFSTDFSFIVPNTNVLSINLPG